jgi:hypothetical protein
MSVPPIHRLIALCAAYAIALQMVVSGLVAAPLGPSLDAAALAVLCGNAGDRPSPVDDHRACGPCVMPGGCAGHALPEQDVAAISPAHAFSIRVGPPVQTAALVFGRAGHAHAARAPPVTV